MQKNNPAMFQASCAVEDEVVYVQRKKKLPTTFRPTTTATALAFAATAATAGGGSGDLTENDDELKKQTFLQKMKTKLKNKKAPHQPSSGNHEEFEELEVVVTLPVLYGHV